jgi:hypothetical protein
MTFCIINCQFEKLSAVEKMPQTKKKCCISSRHKVNISYHNLLNDITLNAA